jgi:hypothetical protein
MLSDGCALEWSADSMAQDKYLITRVCVPID